MDTGTIVHDSMPREKKVRWEDEWELESKGWDEDWADETDLR